METWPIKRMDELCEITSSKRIFAADYVSSGVPFYRGREITEKYKGNLNVSTELFISEARFAEIERKFGAPKSGDLLLTSVGTLGSPYVVKSDDRFYFKDGNLTWFRNLRGVDSRFLYYWLISPPGRAELQKCTIGSSQSAFTIVLLKGMEIGLPPLAEQQRMAEILAAYDELIENNQRRIRILEEMARKLYREWFLCFRFPGHENHPRVASPIGEIPKGWSVKAVTNCVQLNPRILIPKDGEKPFVPMTCLSNDSMVISEIESRTGNSGSKFELGDTLFARITPCLENGKTGYVYALPNNHTAGFGSTEFIVLRGSTVTPEFVYCLARSEAFREHAIKSMTGATGRQRVQEACFAQLYIAEPTKDLLARFSSITSPSFELIHELHQQIQNLRRTRDLLLPRLLSGQIELEAD
jgi:type I restriction enzyme S subunit